MNSETNQPHRSDSSVGAMDAGPSAEQTAHEPGHLRPTHWLAAAAVVVAAMVTGAAVVWAAYAQPTGQGSSAASDAPRLTVRQLSASGTNIVHALDSAGRPVEHATQPVDGTISGKLSAGQTVFVAWRGLNEPGDPTDITAGRNYSGLPCVVSGRAFHCNAVTLGHEPSSKTSVIWVGIANSTATNYLAWAYHAQNQTTQQDPNAGPQGAPAGFAVSDSNTYSMLWSDTVP